MGISPQLPGAPAAELPPAAAAVLPAGRLVTAQQPGIGSWKQFTWWGAWAQAAASLTSGPCEAG